MNKTKILHIPNYFYPHVGGIEQTARDCVNTFMGENYEQKVICFNSEKRTVVDKVDGVEIIRPGTFTKISSQSLSFSYRRILKKTIKEFNPNIIIFHYPNPFVSHFLCKYLKHKKFKFILWWHLDITKQKILGKLFKHQNIKLLKYADQIVSTSPNYIEGSTYLQNYKNKCIVIPSCINEERLIYTEKHSTEAQNIKDKYKGKTICFALGRHVEYKGLTYLIKASKILNNDFAILIGGQGPLTEALKAEAQSDKKVRFLGKLSEDEVRSYFLACDIFCFPSITKNEAFGLSLAEALYFGKPAITFTIKGSGVNYVNLNGETGIEVANKDVEAYAQAIQLLRDNPNLYGKYSENAKERIKENFTFEKFKINLLNLVEKISRREE